MPGHNYLDPAPGRGYISAMPPRRSSKKDNPKKLAGRMKRRWRVVLLRHKGEILGEVEAHDVAYCGSGPIWRMYLGRTTGLIRSPRAPSCDGHHKFASIRSSCLSTARGRKVLLQKRPPDVPYPCAHLRRTPAVRCLTPSSAERLSKKSCNSAA